MIPAPQPSILQAVNSQLSSSSSTTTRKPDTPRGASDKVPRSPWHRPSDVIGSAAETCLSFHQPLRSSASFPQFCLSPCSNWQPVSLHCSDKSRVNPSAHLSPSSNTYAAHDVSGLLKRVTVDPDFFFMLPTGAVSPPQLPTRQRSWAEEAEQQTRGICTCAMGIIGIHKHGHIGMRALVNSPQ